ncbi:S8 family serine peptidase, partial [Actinomadura sp. CNU-125]|uniref:S8 family serine peptidase n=1 Tax=Actinomadura sp. CNU-125 TaxID=1904961 RepID=UPI0021CCD2CE
MRVPLAAALGLLLVAGIAAPGAAAAAPSPHRTEWWLGTWNARKSLWSQSQGQGVTVAVIGWGASDKVPELQGALVPGTDLFYGGDGLIDRDDTSDGYGTALASLIAARGVRTGFLGVAPAAKVMPIVTSNSSQAEGIRYAADHGAEVILLSQAAGASRCRGPLQEAVGYAVERDVVLVAGMGHGRHPDDEQSPGNCAGVLAVGAVDARLKPWAESYRQPYAAVSAPGVALSGVFADGRVRTFDDTAGAAALTAGAVALIRARFPKLPAKEVVRRVIASAADLGARGHDDKTGYGFVRPGLVLAERVPAKSPNPVYEAYANWAAEHRAEKGAEDADRRRREEAMEDSGSEATGYVIMLASMLAVTLVACTIALVRTRRRTAAAGGVGPVAGPVAGPPFAPYPQG